MDCHMHRSVNISGELEQTPRAEGAPSMSRRSLLMLGASALLIGCAEKQMTTTLPGPVWKPRTLPPEPATGPRPALSPTGAPNVIARARWSGGDPVPSLMDRMTAVQWVTVHHDGMDPYFGGDEASSRGRLEAIRRAHRGKGWGDIGYHYAVDRSGRVWEARSIAYQGAHVKDCNPGNVGVLCMGNFDKQTPTQAQLAALNRHINWLLKNYRVSPSHLRTHQEWPNAATACPGVSLQRYMVAARRSGQIGRA
jgi:hypothetical protein